MNDRVVDRESAAYQEFARLYRLARAMRPTAVDRWTGTLYASDTERWGGFNGKTGSIRLSGDRVLRHLTGSPSSADADEQAEALATVLHEATHAGMEMDAPAEPNAVRTPHSLGATEGLAELRAMNDFRIFASLAGYRGLSLPAAGYAGAHAAMNSLVAQATGPAKDRDAFLTEACHGPGVMHFDQLADGVVRNRLSEVVPFRAEDRRAVRGALIGAMLHRGWPTLKDMSAETGVGVAEDIRRQLNSKVDEIRRHYFFTPGEVFPGGVPNPQAGRERVIGRVGGAEQAAEAGAGRAGSGGTGPGNTGPGNAGPGSTGPGNAGPGNAEPGNSGPGNVRPGGVHPDARFLGGAVGGGRGRAVLGDGARGRGGGRDGPGRDGSGRDGSGRGPGRG